ncbi:MAG: magnesium transporter [Nitrospinota bacterium]|nr:MAG: magnesium transporter [Nitrospinota bacterium]
MEAHRQKFFVTLEALRKLIHRQAIAHIRNVLQKLNPKDIAHLLPHFSREEQRLLFALIDDPVLAAEVLRETDQATQQELLSRQTPEKLIEIFREMPSDDVTDIIAILPEELAKQVLERLSAQEAQEVAELLKYPSDTAGGIMNPDFLALPETMTVEEAIREVRKASEVEMVFYIYVVDEKNHLRGVLSLRQLLLASPEQTLQEIMWRDVIKVNVAMDQEEVARIVSRYNFVAIPVVNDEGELVGIITVDDIIDVIREEATEDIFRMAGTDEEELLFSHSILRVARFRLPWLLTSLVGGIISSELIWRFNFVIRDLVALATFIPVIMGMGGNVGTQSAAIVVRGLATGRIDLALIGRTIRREVCTGLVMGGVCGVLLALVATLLHWNPLLGLVVGVSLFFAILVAATMGTLMPVLFRKLGIDPAIASGPFVTTANDITGLLIYFSLATLMLSYLL